MVELVTCLTYRMNLSQGGRSIWMSLVYLRPVFFSISGGGGGIQTLQLNVLDPKSKDDLILPATHNHVYLYYEKFDLIAYNHGGVVHDKVVRSSTRVPVHAFDCSLSLYK